MRRAERIIRAFGSFGEARQPVFLAQRTHSIPPPGQDFVWIGLVADVPDNPIFRRIEYGMQRHRQLNNPQPGAQMAAGFGYGGNRLGAQFVRQPAQLGVGQAVEIGGCDHPIQHWSVGFICHGTPKGQGLLIARDNEPGRLPQGFCAGAVRVQRSLGLGNQIFGAGLGNLQTQQ